jgi:hypothetical protein
MTCQFPDNTAQTAYRKGCRCGRCRAVKSAIDAKRQRRGPFTCPACGAPRWVEGECVACRQPVIQRVVERIAIDPVTECWNWLGSRTVAGNGYGQIKSRGRSYVTHRVTYEHFVGPVPDGLQLDHLCRNTACCNPDHLEPVTLRENIHRARRLVTHCPAGHLYERGPGEADKRCDICRLEGGRRRAARYAAKRREATR